MIKKYTPEDDLKELVSMIREIWLEHYTPIIGCEQVEYMLERFQSEDPIKRQMTEDRYQYFGIFADGVLAGYYAVQALEDRFVFLSKFYTRKSFRGRGFGKMMLSHLEKQWKPLGKSRVWLTVNKNNADSIAIYKKLGFSIIEEIVADIGNGFVMDDYKMEKEF